MTPRRGRPTVTDFEKKATRMATTGDEADGRPLAVAAGVPVDGLRADAFRELGVLAEEATPRAPRECAARAQRAATQLPSCLVAPPLPHGEILLDPSTLSPSSALVVLQLISATLILRPPNGPASDAAGLQFRRGPVYDRRRRGAARTPILNGGPPAGAVPRPGGGVRRGPGPEPRALGSGRRGGPPGPAQERECPVGEHQQGDEQPRNPEIRITRNSGAWAVWTQNWTSTSWRFPRANQTSPTPTTPMATSRMSRLRLRGAPPVHRRSSNRPSGPPSPPVPSRTRSQGHGWPSGSRGRTGCGADADRRGGADEQLDHHRGPHPVGAGGAPGRRVARPAHAGRRRRPHPHVRSVPRAGRRVAAGLAGVGWARAPVSWQLPTRIDTVVLSLALTRLGAVQNPIIHLYREREVGFALRQTGAELFVVPGSGGASTTRPWPTGHSTGCDAGPTSWSSTTACPRATRRPGAAAAAGAPRRPRSAGSTTRRAARRTPRGSATPTRRSSPAVGASPWHWTCRPTTSGRSPSPSPTSPGPTTW